MIKIVNNNFVYNLYLIDVYFIINSICQKSDLLW